MDVPKFQVEEIRMQLSACEIAGKWWGSKEQRPILLLHGWQDNAGSFDTLIPLLPSSLSYLAIDLPGHGLSSHLPKGCFYHTIDLVPLLEEIRIKLKWERLSIIAHSMGSIISFFYASLYPDNVNFVVALDTLKMQNNHPKYTERIYTWRTKKLIELNSNFLEQPPEYTYDELIQRVHEGSFGSVDMNKAIYMLKRSCKPSAINPNKFYFSRDIRVKFMQPFYVEQLICLEYIKTIKSPYLFVWSEDRHFSEPQKHIQEAIQFFKKNNKRFKVLRVKGTHHAHLNQPEQMASKISKFILKYHIIDGVELKSKL